MTASQRRLLDAAKHTQQWMDRRERGALPNGPYDDILAARLLSEAITAVEAEAAQEQELELQAQMMDRDRVFREQQVTRAQIRDGR